MAKLVKEKGDGGRLHIESPLMGESLVSKELLKQTEATEYFRMHPDINVLKIGGQSIMDRGGEALFLVLSVLYLASDIRLISDLSPGETTGLQYVIKVGFDILPPALLPHSSA